MEKAYIEVLDNLWIEVFNKLKKDNVLVEYFRQNIEIEFVSKKFKPDLEIKEKILILHYLLKKNDYNVINDEIISFKELPEGTFYFPSIYSRIYLPLIEKYGKNKEEFIIKGISIGGRQISETSIKFYIFPDVYYIFELIPEDEEFPADIRIFFNKRASEIFEIEDLAIIGEIIISKM